MSDLHPTDVTVSAPCKLNLTLDVFAPRPDGFHDLDSLVVPLSAPFDTVRVTRRPGAAAVRFICKSPDVPKGMENLAARAAQQFLDRFAPPESGVVYVRLEKRLPTQAGLGGGSSDAASVLRAMDALFPDVATSEELVSVAAELGSDVPLFLSDGPVRMQGRGEKVTPLVFSLPPLHGVLVKPTEGVPTGPAYARLDALPDREPGRATQPLLDALAGGHVPDAATLAPLLSNDFEAAVLPHFGGVFAAHEAVTEAGALRTLLCGSGASVFGLARDRDHARDLVRALCGRGFWVKIAHWTLTAVEGAL